MKIIHVMGRSGSGKTTFIAGLILRLEKLGRVATVKHLGHHNYDLAPGKDTTIFFEKGASISAGIDSEKSVLIVRQIELSAILDLYFGIGIDYVIIEGFKSIDIPGVIMGDLESNNALFRNPGHDDIIQNIASFPDYQN